MKIVTRAGNIAQWVKAFVIKPGDLGSISDTHMIEEKKQLPKVFLCLPHLCLSMYVCTHVCMCAQVYVCTHTHKCNNF